MGASQELAVKAKLRLGSFELDVDQVIPLAGVTGVFGPSGGGKSTLLRIISGLERGATGAVSFAGNTWQDSARKVFVAAHVRNVGYVFQDTRLFDHLTVAGNLTFSDKRSRRGNDAIRLDDIISAFDLGALLPRNPGDLSGGERQRVAIARSLLTRPELLLLDEPLAALDIERKQEILPYIESLSLNFGIPIVYVSHSIEEMARLARSVLVLKSGHVRMLGDAVPVLNELSSQWPGSRYDAVTILETSVSGHDDDLRVTRLRCHGQDIVVPLMRNSLVGDSVRLHVRAGDVAIATVNPEYLSFRNVLSGTLASLEGKNDETFAIAEIDIGGAVLRAEITRHAINELELVAGKPVFVLLKTASFDRRGDVGR